MSRSPCFEVHKTYEEDGRRLWCWLERNQARLMLAQADAAVDALHSRLAEAGLEAGLIEPGAPGPDH